MKMKEVKMFDVIIIGGSYSGLSAAMALGRSLRNVLIIDENKPCNSQTPHSHNFITQDGETPADISMKARVQVQKYKTVQFYDGRAAKGIKTKNGFEIETVVGDKYEAKKLIFATGVKDIMPNIENFSECWGRSIIHCPYCHGYEVRNQKTGILGNGEYGFEFSKMINNWTKDLTLYTNGKSTLTDEETNKLKDNNINIIELEIDKVIQTKGQLESILFKDGSKSELRALYSKLPVVQNTDIPEELECQLTESGHILVDDFQKTTIEGGYACGDSTTLFRSVANAVAMGNVAGAIANKDLIQEQF